MLVVTLLTKSGCHLCEEVKAELTALQSRHPHILVEVDITLDDDLFDRYQHAIPVVRLPTAELHAPITAAELQNALATAAAAL
ncbi:MAG: glutaredoxin family protein [Anaerolineales bacterium]|nr:glutaredoxin family protein [Anaerolineales bacterium]